MVGILRNQTFMIIGGNYEINILAGLANALVFHSFATNKQRLVLEVEMQLR